MKNLLIISPHFPPINAPDHQRVRMMLPYFQEFGWNPHLLTVDPNIVQAPQDDSLSFTVPATVARTHARGIPPEWTRVLGFDNLSLRTRQSLRKKGDALLSSGEFDLVLFSTTQTGIFELGPAWQKRWKTPFAVDLQDPLVNDYYQKSGNQPPGGKWKHALSQHHAQGLEKKVLPKASLLLTVSAAYRHEWVERVPLGDATPWMEESFPFSDRDLEQAASWSEKKASWALPPRQGLRFLSAGRGGPDLRTSHAAFFQALRLLADRSCQAPHAFFVGTGYGSNPRPTVLPLAGKCGVDSLVTEHAKRLPYLEVLQAARNAEINVVFGSDDTRYNPSKLRTLLATGRPVLAIVHQQSPAAKLMQDCFPAGLIAFLPEDPQTLEPDRILAAIERCREHPAGARREKLENLEARASTRRICAAMQDCLAR